MQMNRYKNIQDELNELESSLKAGIKPVFNLPEGYFENFPSTVLQRIRLHESEAKTEISGLSPLLASLSRDMPLSVPNNYFEEFTPIAAEQSEVLASIGKTMPYSVPAHYFEDLSDAVHARVWEPKAKVVPFRKRVMRMAAAAIITGLIAISGWVYFNQKSNDVSVNETGQWVSKKLDGVSNQDLEEFINITASDEVSEPIAATAKPEVRNMLTDVSDSELENFLSEIPEDEELSFN
jgi:hypothetical protein